tara:strand:+ start:731 stop:1093 length:363 start_codon:yes stop_codon:yes gene_type:complete
MVDWLNIIPQVKLQKGVPIVPVVRGWGEGPFMFVQKGRGSCVKINTPKDGVQGARPSDFRVDLNSTDGFDFALQWTIKNSGTTKEPKHELWKSLFKRHRSGKTTDEDRLFLAETMADFIC